MTNPIQKPYVLDVSKYVWVKYLGQWILLQDAGGGYIDTRAYLPLVNVVYYHPHVWVKSEDYGVWKSNYDFFDCLEQAMRVAECAVAMGDDTAPLEKYRSLSHYNLENYFENLSSV